VTPGNSPNFGGFSAIGLPVRRGFARRFARRPQEVGNVAVRNREASRINRDERRISEAPPKPSPQFKLVEPHRRLHELLEKTLALRGVEPRPAFHRRLDQRNAPHIASLIQQRKMKKRKTQIC
jgi:hypothetical protein